MGLLQYTIIYYPVAHLVFLLTEDGERCECRLSYFNEDQDDDVFHPPEVTLDFLYFSDPVKQPPPAASGTP